MRYEHDTGFHDDRLFSLGINLIALHQLDVYGAETPQWVDRKVAEQMLTEFTAYSSPTTRGSAADIIDLFHQESHTPQAPIDLHQLSDADVTMEELFTTFSGGVSFLG